MKTSEELLTAIDTDEGLKSKRKLLTIASLTLLALSFSGAKIEEANSFIFKIKFAHQNGLAILLVISIIFLMVRYYNYAKKYHDRLYYIWATRLINRNFFYSRCPHSDQDAGIVADSRSSELDANFEHDVRRWEFKYICGWPFTRYIDHYWGYNDHPEEDRMDRVSIVKQFGMKAYCKSIGYEAIEQTKSFFIHRENLDILAPYFIGCAAIASYYFNAELQELLTFISTSTKK
jgi:hypothetical protein